MSARKQTTQPLSFRAASKVSSTAADAVKGAGMLAKFFAHGAKQTVGGVRSTATNVKAGLKAGWKAS